MPETVSGVPLHPLVVHAVVVLIPLAALGVFAIAVIAKWRYRYGGLVAVVAVVAAALVPVAVLSGRALKDLLGSNDDIDRHQQIAQTLLFTAFPLAILAILLWLIGRRTERGVATARGLVILVATLGVVFALGVGVQVVLIGHSGANAAWSTSP